MGTNYYLVKNGPTTTNPVHIGKSSIGWRFNFQIQRTFENDDDIEWCSYPQVIKTLKRLTVDSDKYVILTEYDEIVSLDEFIDMVQGKQKNNNPDNFSYDTLNVNGYRFTASEFC